MTALTPERRAEILAALAIGATAAFTETAATEAFRAIEQRYRPADYEAERERNAWGYTVRIRPRGIRCAGCDDPEIPTATYVIDFSGDGLSLVRYCAACAALARRNFSGEVATYVGRLGRPMNCERCGGDREVPTPYGEAGCPDCNPD